MGALKKHLIGTSMAARADMFIHEYVNNGMIIWKAYQSVFKCQENSARQNATPFAKSGAVKEALQRYLKNNFMTAEEVVQSNLKRIAENADDVTSKDEAELWEKFGKAMGMYQSGPSTKIINQNIQQDEVLDIDREELIKRLRDSRPNDK